MEGDSSLERLGQLLVENKDDVFKKIVVKHRWAEDKKKAVLDLSVEDTKKYIARFNSKLKELGDKRFSIASG